MWWLTRVSVCHFLDAKLVSFLLNDRGHHLPSKDNGSCWHECWQRLVEDIPWVFQCIWQNLYNLHILQVQTFHHAKLYPNHYGKATIFNCWLQSIHPKFLIRWSPHPYMTTAWELGKWRLIKEDHSLPKSNDFLIISLAHLYLLAMLVGERSGLCLIALPFYPSLPRYLLIDDTFNYISCDRSMVKIWVSFYWSLKALEVSCWWLRMTRTGFYSFLGFVLELGDDMVHSGQWNGQQQQQQQPFILTRLFFPVYWG